MVQFSACKHVCSCTKAPTVHHALTARRFMLYTLIRRRTTVDAVLTGGARSDAPEPAVDTVLVEYV
eukprot:CAMPEP_0206219226 /NCGR_PEP_ID=MMETSP0047_2-20121206/4210_1 /ASSEMBLY_ACC=CAM_ASM_000192 /TAXON_ID=195065 /ORGANISM="Chroomonas mesostigmatica_cf, Strain CCMP1168" /LENGTH=65 /DNA_ID=CAMNT_0053641763 /DNA_START=166 /DNA_END=363 /DNA_ORIENTATION=-